MTCTRVAKIPPIACGRPPNVPSVYSCGIILENLPKPPSEATACRELRYVGRRFPRLGFRKEGTEEIQAGEDYWTGQAPNEGVLFWLHLRKQMMTHLYPAARMRIKLKKD